MVAKARSARHVGDRLPVPPPKDSVAASEISLYRNILKIQQDHNLENLGISFYDAETTIQWSFNADQYFHAASTMKLAVLLGVFRQIEHGDITLESPVHVRNRFTSIVNQEAFMLDLGHDADPDVYGHLGKTLTVRELAYWMITKSSNLATNLLVDIIGIPTIQQALFELEIDGIKVLRGVEDQAAFEAGLNNEVTANGLLKLLRLIADGKACSSSSTGAESRPACPRPRVSRTRPETSRPCITTRVSSISRSASRTSWSSSRSSASKRAAAPRWRTYRAISSVRWPV
jgi:hypothetical protein